MSLPRVLGSISIAFDPSIDQPIGSWQHGGKAMGTDLRGGPGTDASFWDGFLEVVCVQGVRAP